VNLADEAQAYLIERLRMTEDEAEAIRMRLGKEK
jgi:hypothetical protein